MSDASKRWLGISIAVLVAAGLTLTEVVDEAPEWDDPLQAGLVEGTAEPEYETAQDYAPNSLPAVSLGLDRSEIDAGELAAAEVAGQPLALFETEPRAELRRVWSLGVDGDGHFVPSRASSDFFASYYTAYPQTSDDVVRGRIVLELLDGLSPRAADEAISELDRWRAAR